VFCMPCGFRLEGSEAQGALLAAHKGWAALLAAKAGMVYAVDGSWYFNRPGPRVVDGIEIMARLLHPDAWRGPVPQGYVTVS
jgi:iron complex transport system substrate-binding protein